VVAIEPGDKADDLVQVDGSGFLSDRIPFKQSNSIIKSIFLIAAQLPNE
jgi:hypothetical protein